MDAVKVTVRGGKRRKVTTRYRSGAMAERYEVRWRVRLAGGECRDFRQRFDRAVEADQHVRLPQAVGLPARNTGNAMTQHPAG